MIGRRNIPPEMFQELQQRYAKDGIETFTDIIIGLPGETYDSFTKGVEKIIENGQHNRIQFINLSILPNAPMAKPNYREQHGLISVESKIINIHGAPADFGDNIFEMQELVVGSAVMSLEDWRQARVFAWTASLLYFDKLLQIPIMLLRATTGIDYVQQIKAFINLPGGRFPLLEELAGFFFAEAKRIQQGGSEFFYAPDWLGIYWPHDEYAYIRLSAENKLGAFYQEVYQRLAELLSDNGHVCPPWLNEAINLNQILLKQPYQAEDLVFRSDYDLLATCDEVRKTGIGSVVQQSACYVVNRKNELWTDWQNWSRDVVWYGNKRGAYLYPYTRQEKH